jgi:hypothetical protein
MKSQKEIEAGRWKEQGCHPPFARWYLGTLLYCCCSVMPFFFFSWTLCFSQGHTKHRACVALVQQRPTPCHNSPTSTNNLQMWWWP